MLTPKMPSYQNQEAATSRNATDLRLQDEGHEHLGRALIGRIRVGELPGEIALLNRCAVDEVSAGEAEDNEPRPTQSHRRTEARQQNARVDGMTDQTVGSAGHQLRIVFL